MKKYVIFSPHADDELIGCYTLFQKKLVETVIYIEGDEKRMKESIRFCKAMKVDYIFIEDIVYFASTVIADPNLTYLVPSLNERHPLHNLVSICVKNWAKKVGYYSTEMNDKFIVELTDENKKGKQKLLNKYYPSQRSLWKYEWKFFIYEGIVAEV